MDEADSIAAQSYAAFRIASSDYHTLIAPRFPEKLLVQNAQMRCAYDFHSIHPEDLVGQASFADIHGTLWKIMGERNWVCWNADFDVALLDSLCVRHRLPLIPRNRVVCAMKLLSPLAGRWDAGRDAYLWAKLEDILEPCGWSSGMRWAHSKAQRWALT